MSAAQRIADAAIAMVGSRFRPHGIDPATGVDCVGMVIVAARAGGVSCEPPAGYALRGGDPAAIAARIEASGLVPAPDPPRPGDIGLYISGPAQMHFAITAGAGLVHADAMLRRAVERPGAPPWPLIGRWRLPEKE